MWRVLDGDICVDLRYVHCFKWRASGRLQFNEAISKQLKPLFAFSFVCKFSTTSWNLPENDKGLAKLLLTQETGWNQTVIASFPGSLRCLTRQAPARVFTRSRWHFPQQFHFGDPAVLGFHACYWTISVAQKIASKSHFVTIVLEDRVSMRIKIVIGLPKIKINKTPNFYFG